MAIDVLGQSFSRVVSISDFTNGVDQSTGTFTFTFGSANDTIVDTLSETANGDGTPPNFYLPQNLLTENTTFTNNGTGTLALTLDIPKTFFEQNFITNPVVLTYDIHLQEIGQSPATTDVNITLGFVPEETTLQNDYQGILRANISQNELITEVRGIEGNTTTELQFVENLLSRAANETIPAVAVEGSMYGAVGSSAEIDKLVNDFLPAQVGEAINLGLNPQVFACETLGLAFAFGNEAGNTTFSVAFGPLKTIAPGVVVGMTDLTFAATATSEIFGSDATANTLKAVEGFVSTWEAFYSNNGLPGIPNPTPDQITIAARGAAWGDAMGVALANNLGPFPSAVTNFLGDAAHGTANYSASFGSQPAAGPFETALVGGAGAAQVHLLGVAASVDHVM